VLPRLIRAGLVILLLSSPAAARQQTADLSASIDALSAFDYATRMNAARLVRRAPASEALPALSRAVRGHADQFVRYRSLVLLTSFNDPGTGAIMRGLLADRNDRIREVAYRWFEHHPEPALHATLLAALATEQAEFVRPALVRALAAHADDANVQRALLQEAGRGLDFFRIAVVQALGEHQATYATSTIAAMTALDGPIQDDAILALGRIGDRTALSALSAVSKPAPEVAAALEAALCLLGDKCDERIAWLAQAARSELRTNVARAIIAVLGAVAAEGHQAALTALFDLERTTDRLRGEIALAFSTMALRRPQQTLAWFAQASDDGQSRATALLHEGFESLEEDFAEEQFFAAARAAYWAAPEASAVRTVTASLIDRLEF
jgi:hypothetical protein